MPGAQDFHKRAVSEIAEWKECEKNHEMVGGGLHQPAALGRALGLHTACLQPAAT
jgi:hypothetical protein